MRTSNNIHFSLYTADASVMQALVSVPLVSNFTLCAPVPINKFSRLISTPSLWNKWGEFYKRSENVSFDNHFLNSYIKPFFLIMYWYGYKIIDVDHSWQVKHQGGLTVPKCIFSTYCSHQHQFSPNDIHRLSSAKSKRINKMITKRKIFDLLSNSLN